MYSWVTQEEPNILTIILEFVATPKLTGTIGLKNPVTFSRSNLLFSLDEPARYDITAQLNFVSRKANSRKIIYVGHSMGGTIGVFHGVVNKQQAEELLAGYIFIAPVVYLIRYRLIWPIVFGIAPVLKVSAI